MKSLPKSYLYLLLIHIGIGVAIYILPFLSKIYGLSILVLGTYLIVKKGNKSNEALLAAAYITGAEVFLRMTDGVFLYEFGKYSVVFFMMLGIFYRGFSKNALPYWGFLLLLIPGILIATQSLNIDTDIRKRILFNLSGPICLGVSAIYCFNRKISIRELNSILLALGLPILACAVYLTLYVPDLKTVLTSTQSNFDTSGGFGPNQVATALGLGMFVFFVRAVMESSSILSLGLNLGIAAFIGYRGLVTFSRGGMITGLGMILIMLFFMYMQTKGGGKMKLKVLLIVSVMAFSGVWMLTQMNTDGLIEKRYKNQDAMGKVKESNLTGREKIADTEIQAFLDNPIFGVGVAKAKEIRADELGEEVASHSEVTRLLAEHGSFGIMALLILTLTPAVLYINNRQHVYMFSFLIFWFFTINHAAMRIAAPAFVYALSVLKVYFPLPESEVVLKSQSSEVAEI